MVQIKSGDTIRAESVHTGTSSNGDYFLCRVKAEKGRDCITVWNNDGFTCQEGESVRINEIQSVKFGQRKYNDKWYPDVSIVASLSSVEPQKNEGAGFSELYGGDGELPF